jgi:hypothetical protein
MPQWANWKEQLNFTKIDEEFQIPLAFPRFKATQEVSLLQ